MRDFATKSLFVKRLFFRCNLLGIHVVVRGEQLVESKLLEFLDGRGRQVCDRTERSGFGDKLLESLLPPERSGALLDDFAFEREQPCTDDTRDQAAGEPNQH